MLDDTQALLPEIWSTHARFRSAELAVVCGDTRWSWAEFNSRMNQFANSLLRDGCESGQKVAVLMGNSAETLQVMLGIVKAGGCVVPISTLLQPTQVNTLLRDSGASWLFVDKDRDELAAAALVDADISEAQCISLGGGRFREFKSWIDASLTHEPPVRYSLDDPFNVIYSSGTTGLPKGILQSHRARQHWSWSNALELRMDHRTVALATTSLYSNGTWFMLLPPLLVGATVVVMESFDIGSLQSLVAAENVTHTFMVPTQYIGLLNDPGFDVERFASLQYYLSAGSSLRQETREQLLATLGPGLFELYGFTEGFATMCRPEQMHKRGSVGTPVVGFDLRILDDAGGELPAGEVGEIAGYGAGVMRGYLNRPEETQELIWRDERGRSFIRSGDIGKLDEEGFLYILDRKKDMILSGGFNVFPKDIEEVVGQHEAVLDVTVIGIPHEKWGEVPMAIVIPMAEADTSEQALLEWANDRLSKTQRLRALEFRPEFPRNALGKVLKRDLRAQYWD